jgi:hypothetical protein
MSSTIIIRYAFKSGSRFSGVLGSPGLGEVGVLGPDDGEWSWFLFNILNHQGNANQNNPEIFTSYHSEWLRSKIQVTTDAG